MCEDLCRVQELPCAAVLFTVAVPAFSEEVSSDSLSHRLVRARRQGRTSNQSEQSMAVAGGTSAEATETSRAHAVLRDIRAGDQDHPDFRDVESGGILWKASLVLLYFLERKIQLRGKKILEISSGEGHVACELHRCGAHVTATEHGDEGVTRLATNVAVRTREGASGDGSIRVVPLTWGEGAWAQSPLALEEPDYDYIVMSELVFDADLHDELVWTMQRLCSPKTVVYHIFLDRPFSFMFLAKVDDTDAFHVTAVADEDLDHHDFLPADAGVHMHIFTLKTA
jgi:predicted nicotinamide N-methyase